ncbi:thiamine phosphate synthase [Sphingomonas sp. Leaf357]|uniref:thiamine phosphate synthase n=1 Tax=Sphingomonas sp. Leaf357 TaxID=1736350 RepID=UPI001F19E2FC|nr:thiamine phosphate synthase [Sphingomonas sp. Leaf357]
MPLKLPRLWLMTDERMGEDLWRALQTLPRGSGIVFRHYATPAKERRAMFRKLAKVAHLRGFLLVRAGPVSLGRERGVHGKGAIRSDQIRTWPVHSRREALAGARAGADLILVSPVFPTASHPGAPALGPIRAARIIQGLPVPAIALGGMTKQRGLRLRRLGFHGWAAIDAWITPRR